MSDANRASMGYVEETTWGTTPTGALQTLRITGESLQDNEEVAESAEILADRNLRDLIRSGEYSSGSVNFELTDDVLDDLLEGVMGSDWATNVLTNGTTKKSYSFEKKLPVDGSPATHYWSITGARLDTLGLTFSRGAVITGSLGLIGKAGNDAATSIGTSYTAAAATPSLSAKDITTLTEAAASPGYVTEFSLNIGNNLRRQHALAATDPIGIGYGGLRVTGSMSMYFADMALYAKYEAETKSALILTVTTPGSPTKTLSFSIPKARWGAPSIPIPGVNQDIIATFPFTGVYDSGIAGTMKVTRSA